MRLAFITPRYGPDILGGAESLTRGFAERLAQQGWSVEILTTCARDYHNWQNVYSVGIEPLNGVIIRRFATQVNNIWPEGNGVVKAYGNFPDGPEAEYQWLNRGMHSPSLYHYLLHYGQNFDLLIFIPYPFQLICCASSLFPDRSIIWPCLHPEAHAYFMPVRVMLNRARGIILNSNAEERFLSQKLQINNPHRQVIGFGLETPSADAKRFYARYPHLKAPFILYAGRLEKAKNVPLLVDYFINYVQISEANVNLVLIGNGPVVIPDHPRIFQLGYLDEQVKHDTYAAATVLCQPSIYESFGITPMEAWLHETPVLVHRDCRVTVEHCLAAKGGLYFQDEIEFKETLDFLLTHPKVTAQLGQNGRIYVETNYNWDKAIKKLVNTLESWLVV